MGLGILKDGKWISRREQEDSEGKFIRPSTTFRDKITADGSSGFKAQAGRYHLYISWACPWACRTAIMRQLKGLQDVIGLSVVAAEIHENSWEFKDEPGAIPDTVNHTDYLWQLYLKAQPDYTGRVTVPVLWDKQKRQLSITNPAKLFGCSILNLRNFLNKIQIFILMICKKLSMKQ